MLNWITWTASPDIFSIGPVTVRYYGVFFAVSFIFAYWFFKYCFTREGIPNISAELDRLAIYSVLGVVVGARLGHIIFYEPQDYLQDPMEILKIWHGGLASHGAAIGMLISMYIYSRHKNIPNYMWILDRVIVTIALGGCFVRLGNLMNSEIYGHETTLPWGFRFVQDISAQHNILTPARQGCEMVNNMLFCPRHPTQLYEAFSYLIIWFILFMYYRRKTVVPPGRMFGAFLVMLFMVRFLVEFLKEDQVAFEQSLPLNMGQMLSIPFILIGAFIFYRSFRQPQSTLTS